MLTFWGLLNETDIESYTATLLLPAYMSHLRRSPFQFGDQGPNSDGQQALVITYLGEGRVEEYSLNPRKHALPLLCSICPTLEPASIRINPEKSIWRWSEAFTKESNDSDDPSPAMRLYFAPVFSAVRPDCRTSFDPSICYVSVSRREMYLGSEVLRSYLAGWLDRLEGNSRMEYIELEPIAEGWEFRGRRIGGRFSLQEGEVFRDLLAYAGLARSLDEVSKIISLDFENAATEITEKGVRFHLS